MPAADVFPKNYDEARAQFLALATTAAAKVPGAQLKRFNVPSKRDANLFVDELYVPGQTDQLLILSSGVHGLEASLGSAVQAQFIRESLETAHAKGIAVWIVHCLNPFGFKFGRRTTEDNINLNRNFTDSYQTPNDGYLKLVKHFEKPAKAASSFHVWKTLAFLIGKIASRQFSTRTLSQAISQGQFTNPHGLEFGGRGPTPQVAYFQKRFDEISNAHKEIILIDLHTGLGKRSRLHLLTGWDSTKCIHKDSFARLFKLEDDAALYEFNSGDEKGFYQTIGDINTMVAERAHDKKVVALTFEFGTLGNSLVSKADSLSRAWLENQGHFHGYASEAHERKIKQRFRELFEPQDLEWQRNALAITRQVLGNLVERL